MFLFQKNINTKYLFKDGVFKVSRFFNKAKRAKEIVQNSALFKKMKSSILDYVFFKPFLIWLNILFCQKIKSKLYQ